MAEVGIRRAKRERKRVKNGAEEEEEGRRRRCVK
jgi:hypothetical protein